MENGPLSMIYDPWSIAPSCRDRYPMGKYMNPEMKNQPLPSPSEETDPRLLEALASLNQIGEAINQIGPSDAGSNDISLQLVVESAIRVVPGSSAVIYTYDQVADTFEKE